MFSTRKKRVLKEIKNHYGENPFDTFSASRCRDRLDQIRILHDTMNKNDAVEGDAYLVDDVTWADLEMDEVTGLTMGADDFLTKPFSLAVLRARVTALIRRSLMTGNATSGDSQADAVNDKSAIYEIDDMVFDFDKLIFKKGEEEIFLSVNEQRLLKVFLDNKGMILTRDTLIERLWGDSGEYVEENALSVTVNRLRSKIESSGGTKHINTVYGQGYRFE